MCDSAAKEEECIKGKKKKVMDGKLMGWWIEGKRKSEKVIKGDLITVSLASLLAFSLSPLNECKGIIEGINGTGMKGKKQKTKTSKDKLNGKNISLVPIILLFISRYQQCELHKKKEKEW